LPIGRREVREAVDLLDEQHVVGPGVRDEPKQFWPRQLRARFVLDILSHDVQAVVGGERFDCRSDAGRILFIGRGAR
jgi:hypothetical protein